MKSLIFQPGLWLISVVVTFTFNVESENFGNSSSILTIDSFKLLLFTQTALAQKTSSNSVIVYGNPRCGWTNSLIQQLKARKIPYQFRNLDVQSIQTEWYQVLIKNGITDGVIDLPVVLVNSKLFIRPSIEQVINQRKKGRNSSSNYQGYCTFLPAAGFGGKIVNDRCQIKKINNNAYQLIWSNGRVMSITFNPASIDGNRGQLIQKAATSATVKTNAGRVGFCWNCNP